MLAARSAGQSGVVDEADRNAAIAEANRENQWTLPKLRTLLTNPHPAWKLTQFAPHAVYRDMELVKRALGEMQDVLLILIERINNCKDC